MKEGQIALKGHPGMSSTEPIGNIWYNSTYVFGVDEKRRVQIPAKWRPSNPDIEFTLMEWSTHPAGTYLRVLPPGQMAKMVRDIDEMPNGDPQKPILKRTIGRRSVQAPLDKAGRICLPEEKAKAAGIKDQVVMVGLLDQFEIWSPERFAVMEDLDNARATDALRLME